MCETINNSFCPRRYSGNLKQAESSVCAGDAKGHGGAGGAGGASGACGRDSVGTYKYLDLDSTRLIQ